MPRTARQCADELEGIWDAADREGRELTPAERAHVEQLIESAKSQHSIEKGIREIGLQLGPGGGGQVVWPDGSGVRGGSPGERLAFSATDEPVKKIATSITISDELLSDAPAVQTFVNGQLSLFVQIEAERQLLRGTRGGNEVQGILTSRGVPVYAGGTAVGNKAVQLFIAMNGVRGSAFVEPEWVVCHPTDYQEIRLLRDTAGQFLGGGPFLGPYGAGSNLQASGQLGGAIDSIWNKQVYVSSVVGAGTALVGSRAAGQVWSRGGLSVEASNSHASYFTSDLVAIRAERRLALTLYRPGRHVRGPLGVIHTFPHSREARQRGRRTPERRPRAVEAKGLRAWLNWSH